MTLCSSKQGRNKLLVIDIQYYNKLLIENLYHIRLSNFTVFIGNSILIGIFSRLTVDWFYMYKLV